MTTRELVAASTRPLLLSVLARGESYGYAIIQAVLDLSGGELEWSEGMLYPALHRLEREGLVLSRWKTSDEGRKRKYYRLSANGRKALEKEKSQWLSMHETLLAAWGEGAMSVLNEWVATWRASLDCRGELTSDQLDELESHLRDGVERTRQLGLSDRDAFLLAAARVGTPDAIRAEYGKAHPENIWVTRTFWMVVGFLSFQAAGTLVGTLSQAAVAATARYFDWYYLLVISSLVSVAAWAAGLYYYDSRLGSLARPRSLSLAVVIAILVSIPLLSMLVDAGMTMWMVRNVDRYGAAMIAVRGQSLLLSVAVPIGLLLYSRSLRGKRTGKRSASRTPLG